MSCCEPANARSFLENATEVSGLREEIRLTSRDLGDGLRQTVLSVPDIHCGACIASVERALKKVEGVESARVNLSTKRVTVNWRDSDGPAPDLITELAGAGHASHLFAAAEESRDPALTGLIKALAVAGFCSMNIMMLSLSVWSGADAQARYGFHLVSAALALPAILYSGRVFYASAWSALRHGRSNMDVPISIGVLLAFGLSLYDTFQNAPHAYFDASTSLLFFLLIGRTLDHLMRQRARSAVSALARLSPSGAMVIADNGARDYIALGDIRPGMRMIIAAGERVPVDGIVSDGRSELDCALVSGESQWKPATVGTVVQAGVMNLANPLVLTATARAEDSFLAEMVRLMEAAEGGRARYRRLADRASSLYSPVVHAVAALSLFGWLYATGDWHLSITIAIAVLIVTCPCALGLAVPIVQVVAARRLFESGIMVKDGSALERLAEADSVIFDKTGTLTSGKPRLVNTGEIPAEVLATAVAMARLSRHPVSAAIAASYQGDAADLPVFESVEEIHGLGVEARMKGDVYRLGRPAWASGEKAADPGAASMSASVLARNGEVLATFLLTDRLRDGAKETVAALRQRSLAIEILSGDAPTAVAGVAAAVGIDAFAPEMLPADKVDHIRALQASGRKVLMVGDGLNDAPALSAAHVSMAPATAVDIGRNAADFVFLHDNLRAVDTALHISLRAGALIRQNFVLAIGYNVIVVPVAIAGHVTPLLAAIAMSMSSVLVVANALRLGRPAKRRIVPTRPAAAGGGAR